MLFCSCGGKITEKNAKTTVNFRERKITDLSSAKLKNTYLEVLNRKGSAGCRIDFKSWETKELTAYGETAECVVLTLEVETVGDNTLDLELTDLSVNGKNVSHGEDNSFMELARLEKGEYKSYTQDGDTAQTVQFAFPLSDFHEAIEDLEWDISEIFHIRFNINIKINDIEFKEIPYEVGVG